MSTSWLLWSFALLFLIGGLILVYGFAQADRLVRAEHDLHPDASPRSVFSHSCLGWYITDIFEVASSLPYVLPDWNLLCAAVLMVMIYVAVHKNA
jgi:hypothetical protein